MTKRRISISDPQLIEGVEEVAAREHRRPAATLRLLVRLAIAVREKGRSVESLDLARLIDLHERPPVEDEAELATVLPFSRVVQEEDPS